MFLDLLDEWYNSPPFTSDPTTCLFTLLLCLPCSGRMALHARCDDPSSLQARVFCILPLRLARSQALTNRARSPTDGVLRVRRRVLDGHGRASIEEVGLMSAALSHHQTERPFRICDGLGLTMVRRVRTVRLWN